MLVALILLAVLTVEGATSLSVAGVDQRIAYHNQRHVIMSHTAHAGTQHARSQLSLQDPASENIDSADTAPDSNFISMRSGETNFEGIDFDQNLGVYWVEAIFLKCGVPPPGYSAEQGNQAYRSDYWNMFATAVMMSDNGTNFTRLNEAEASVVSTLREVVRGTCKIR